MSKCRGRAAKQQQQPQPQQLCSWQAPPDGLFDVIVPMLSSKEFVVVQLVCRDWCRAARKCLKEATPRRPDVDLQRLARVCPNLTHLDLSLVEGLSTARLAPLHHLTALRSLCLSNISAQDQQAAANMMDTEQQQQAASPLPASLRRAPPRTRSRAAGLSTAPQQAEELQPPTLGRRQRLRSTEKSNGSGMQALQGSSGSAEGGEAPDDGPPPGPGPSSCEAASRLGRPARSAGGAGSSLECSQGGVAGGSCGPPSLHGMAPEAMLEATLRRLNRLQADLCPALSAESIATLHNLTELTVDTLVAAEQLAPLTKLQARRGGGVGGGGAVACGGRRGGGGGGGWVGGGRGGGGPFARGTQPKPTSP